MVTEKEMKKIDIILLILFPIIAVIISFLIKANMFTSILLFYGLPAVYFSYRTKKAIKKTLIFSLLFALPASIIIDYFAVIDKTWQAKTIFSFKLFNLMPVEDFMWGFFFAYAVIIFYEHFLDKTGDELINKNMKHFIGGILTLLLIFIIALTLNSGLNIPYFYFYGGLIIMLIPTITFLSFFPRLITKFTITGAYFFIVAVLSEFTALSLNQWSFPGTNFIGWVEILGFRFPVEEFFFFFIIGAIWVLTYYEFFDDDRK